MIILRDAVILHVPRTGGNWLIHNLRLSGIPHEVGEWVTLPRNLYRKPILDKHAIPDGGSRSRACFVRHPISYYESVWKMLANVRSLRSFMIRCRRHGHWSPFLDPYRCFNRRVDDVPEFREWVLRMTSRFPGWASGVFDRYARGCQFVGRVENIESDASDLIGGLGFELQYTSRKINAIPSNLNWHGLESAVLDSEREMIDRWYANGNYHHPKARSG